MKRISTLAASLALAVWLFATYGCAPRETPPIEQPTTPEDSVTVDPPENDVEEEPTIEEARTEVDLPEETEVTAPAEAQEAVEEPEQVAQADVVEDEAVEEGWGHLKGRFVYDGDPPARERLNVTRDTEFCTQEHPLDETVVVNTENKGIANVLVTLNLRRGEQPPEPHPSYEEMDDQELLLDNVLCRFEPRMLFVQTGQTLIIGNSDPIGHNTNANLFANPAFNETIPANGQLTKTFQSAEPRPAQVSCTIHPWMRAWLVIEEHPYAAVTDEDGNFEIRYLPEGEWTFQVWQEQAGFVTNVTIDGEQEEWTRGRVDFPIESRTLDLGDILVPPGEFQR